MAITTLPNFPHVWQLHDPTSDGMPDENANWNCVPASLAAGLEYLTGRTYDADELHDAIYGQGYLGGQAAASYVAYCAHEGVALTPYDGPPMALIEKIHAELSAGNPVVLTMPSQWGIPLAQQVQGFTTHVGIACGQDTGEIRVMNPWLQPPAWHDGTDQYWADRLCDHEVWVMAREVAMAFVKQPDGTGKDSKGNTCGQGMMYYLEQHAITADGRRSELYMGGLGPVKAFLTLANGQTLTWDGANVGEDSADVIEGLMAQLAAKAAAPAPTPAPAGVVLALQALKAALANV